jgi:hypothetical protein
MRCVGAAGKKDVVNFSSGKKVFEARQEIFEDNTTPCTG